MESAHHDHYRVLQVDPSANQLVIQAAYRVLARIFHPDVQGDDEQMKRLNAAWEVLGDPRRRAAYDSALTGRHPGPDAPARAAWADPTPTSTSTHGAPAPAPVPGASSSRAPDDHPGPPLGEPFGPVLQFGRYAGWTLGQVSRIERGYLEWLRQAPAGRGLKDEIDAALRSHGRAGVDRRRYDADRQQQVHSWVPAAPTKIR